MIDANALCSLIAATLLCSRIEAYAPRFLPLNRNQNVHQSTNPSVAQRTANHPSASTATTLFLAGNGAPPAVSGLPFFASLEPVASDGTGSMGGSTAATVTTRVPLGTIFDSSRDFIFSTATNVRGYEWTLKETDELLDDLTDAAGIATPGATSLLLTPPGTISTDSTAAPKQDYELSQVVLVPMEWDRDAYGLGQIYDVHDGQQRIVTLCLLFAALRESFRLDDTELVEELTNMLNPPKVRKEPVLRIALRKRDNDSLRRILLPELVRIEGNGARAASARVNVPTGAERKALSSVNVRVLTNYERLLDRVMASNKKDRLALLDYMVEHVYLLVCVPETARIARNIVMAQGKGMDNEPIDDFKGLVCFRYTVEEDDMYRTFDKWDELAAAPDVESYSVGRDIVAKACLLRAATALKTKIRKNDEINAMERWLRQDLVENMYEGKDFFTRNIRPASLILGRFREGSFDSFIKDAKTAGDLELTIATRLKFLLALTTNVGSTKDVELAIVDLLLLPNLTNAQLDQCLHAIELVAIWMALQRPSPMQRHQRCFELIDAMAVHVDDWNKLRNTAISPDELSVMKSNLRTFEFGATANGKKIASALLERLNAYYILAEGAGVEIPDGDQHLEYVLPKKPTGAYWKEVWPNEEEALQCTYLLGNLALLSGKPTGRQTNKDFDEKKERYEQEPWPLTSSLAEWTIWNKDAHTEQQEWIIGLVDTMWGL